MARNGVTGASAQDAEDAWAMNQKLLSTLDSRNLTVLDGPMGPLEDPRFPSQLVTQTMARSSEEVVGLWDAKNEASLAWHEKATTELATITLFAIALYLFGQSLGMGRTRAALILVAMSSFLVATGGAVALYVRATPLPGRPHSESALCTEPGSDGRILDPAEDAARHYAEGRRKYLLATTSKGYGEAAKEFQCAVDARPTFALADYYLSRAALYEDTPQQGEGYVSLTSKHALATTVHFQEMTFDALDRKGFTRPSRLMGNYGFDSLVLGLAKHDRARLDRALLFTQGALVLNRDAQWLRFNLALAQLALGREWRGRPATSAPSSRAWAASWRPRRLPTWRFWPPTAPV